MLIQQTLEQLEALSLMEMANKWQEQQRDIKSCSCSCRLLLVISPPGVPQLLPADVSAY